MKLKYKNTDNVTIGSRDVETTSFQITNHYNMVTYHLAELGIRLDEYRRKHHLFADMDFDMIMSDFQNAKAQHFNEGYEIANLLKDKVEKILEAK